METERVIADVSELVQLTRLVSIMPTRILVERSDDELSDDDESVPIEPLHALSLTLRDDESGFRVRFTTDIIVPFGRIGCDVEAEYEVDGAKIRAQSTGAMAEFVNGVALMHVFPYTRQHLADATARVFGTALLMPIVQRGDISFSVTYNEDKSDLA